MAKKKGKLKGKKKKGKKSKKGEKKKKEFDPPIYNIPEFEDPYLVSPKIDLIIRLANPQNAEFEIKTNIAVITRVGQIIDLIKKKHQGAINQIRLCTDLYNMENSQMNENKTLLDYKITGKEPSCTLYYDFDPVKHPLLI